MQDVTVKLLLDDELAEQIDILWDNPYTVHGNMGGVCTFWPKPQKAEDEGIIKDFNFVLVVEKEGYESVRHAFTLPVVSAKAVSRSFDITDCHEINDIYMFSSDDDDEMQLNPL